MCLQHLFAPIPIDRKRNKSQISVENNLFSLLVSKEYRDTSTIEPCGFFRNQIDAIHIRLSITWAIFDWITQFNCFGFSLWLINFFFLFSLHDFILLLSSKAISSHSRIRETSNCLLLSIFMILMEIWAI